MDNKKTVEKTNVSRLAILAALLPCFMSSTTPHNKKMGAANRWLKLLKGSWNPGMA